MNAPRWPIWRALAGIAGSALLLGVYARGGIFWPLGFVALLPWLLALDATHSLRGALASALAMSIAFALAVFAWFAIAIGSYTGIGTPLGALALGLLAPLLQPQWLAFALVRQLVGLRHGPWLRALAAAAAWVGCEWLWPKLLGDTLGHGLAPATTLRQAADLGGAAGLTLLLILANEALALAFARARGGVRAWLAPLALAAAIPAGLWGYGWLRLAALAEWMATPTPALRIGLVQANITDYERLRAEFGAYAVVRHVLDTHFHLSRAAILHHGAEALLWSETVYPTTFGQARSEDGAALDREILDFVESTQVPLVFGTYDLDAAGEYNAAALIEPGRGLVGHYRKTHPFPLTERVPAWLDGPRLRRWVPWAGTWQAGDGARVYTLRSADGRTLDVQPLICLDDVVPQLAIDGARLGAQAIVGLSNDAWFSANPQGARLHLAVASFRSIETRMPQLRVTSNGLSAFVDPTGEVLVSTALRDQAVLAGEVPARAPPLTLMVRWGDWVGRAALALLALLVAVRLGSAWPRRVDAPAPPCDPATWTADLSLLRPAARATAALLRGVAALVLATLGLRMLLVEGLQVNTLWQVHAHVAGVLLPLLLAFATVRGSRAQARIAGDLLVLTQRARRIEIPLANLARLHPWRLPQPLAGVDLEFASGRRWTHGLALADPAALQRVLAAAGSPVAFGDTAAHRHALRASVRAAAHRRWLDHAGLKFVLYPLLLALPAFRLHQVIAFGGTFGEWYTFGAQAWFAGLAIWWAAWSLGLMLLAAVLRAGSEAVTRLALWWRPDNALRWRRACEWVGRCVYYLGVPAWVLLRVGFA